jgi:hypothetical protein
MLNEGVIEESPLTGMCKFSSASMYSRQLQTASALTLRFSGGARSAFKLKERAYLRSMLSRRQLEALGWRPIIGAALPEKFFKPCLNGGTRRMVSSIGNP